MLHVIAAMLSLLLLAGLFGSGLDATDEATVVPSSEDAFNDTLSQATGSI